MTDLTVNLSSLSPNSTWLVKSRLDTTREHMKCMCSTCRAHAFWLCWACQTARFDTLTTKSSTGSTPRTCRAHTIWLCRACRTARLDTLVLTRSTRRTCRFETWRAKWNFGFILFSVIFTLVILRVHVTYWTPSVFVRLREHCFEMNNIYSILTTNNDFRVIGVTFVHFVVKIGWLM